MTKIRRIAQIVEDLKTLGVLTNDKVSCIPSLLGGIMVTIQVPKIDSNTYFLVKYAFEKEFLNDVNVIEDSAFLQFIIY